jgi:hypothetical protein
MTGSKLFQIWLAACVAVPVAEVMASYIRQSPVSYLTIYYLVCGAGIALFVVWRRL